MERTATTWTRRRLLNHMRDVTAELDGLEALFKSHGRLDPNQTRWLLGHFRYQLAVIRDLSQHSSAETYTPPR